MDELEPSLMDLAIKARSGYKALSQTTPQQRTKALQAMAAALREQSLEILKANQTDLNFATENQLSEAMLDRLRLNEDRIEAMAKAIEAVSALPDPVGREIARWQRPNGLDIARVATPIGVIGIIYESRPNVTADAAALCVRSGNGVILRAGSEAFHSSQAIYSSLVQGLVQAGLDPDCLQIVPTKDREAVGHTLKGLGGRIDLLIPRGGKSLVARVQSEARVPVLAHLEGVNHTYVHRNGDKAKAIGVILNAKMRRPSVCGATETVLIDLEVAEALLPDLTKTLIEAGCELRGCERTRMISPMASAQESDWSTEYNAPILSILIVDSLKHALAHIATYGTSHTEAIITEDPEVAEAFLNSVDAAIVMHNTSTQFADGGEFGLGAEIGIATGRLHARGPVGADQLTTFKYKVRGVGQIRA